jgi:hypothetical protein
LTKREAGPGFVEVKQTAGTGIRSGGNEILIEKGDLRIHLPLGISVGDVCVIGPRREPCMTVDLSTVRIFIRPGQTDLRKGVNGLTALV